MTQWEYKAIFISTQGNDVRYVDRHQISALEPQLNELGSQGWELVAFNWDTTISLFALFKRPKP